MHCNSPVKFPNSSSIAPSCRGHHHSLPRYPTPTPHRRLPWEGREDGDGECWRRYGRCEGECCRPRLRAACAIDIRDLCCVERDWSWFCWLHTIWTNRLKMFPQFRRSNIPPPCLSFVTSSFHRWRCSKVGTSGDAPSNIHRLECAIECRGWERGTIMAKVKVAGRVTASCTKNGRGVRWLWWCCKPK